MAMGKGRQSICRDGELLCTSIARKRPIVQARSWRCASTSSIISPSTSPSTPAASTSELVSNVDRPSFLASRFYPTAVKQHFLAIRAFNIEVARVAESVENELMARIRVAWWRDAIKSTYQSKAPRHPTMLSLADAIHDPAVLRHGGLVEDHFIRICDARENDLTAPSSPPTLDEVEAYAEATSSRLYYLSLNLLGLSHPVLDEVFSHLGKASGIALMLSAMPFHAGVIRSSEPLEAINTKEADGGEKKTSKSRGPARPRQRRVVLPSGYLHAHKVVEEEVYRRGSEARGLKDAVFDTATRANDYLITARTLMREEFKGKIPPAAIAPLVNAVPARTFLEELQRKDFDIFDPALQLVASGRGWRLPWSMWKVGISGNL